MFHWNQNSYVSKIYLEETWMTGLHKNNDLNVWKQKVWGRADFVLFLADEKSFSMIFFKKVINQLYIRPAAIRAWGRIWFKEKFYPVWHNVILQQNKRHILMKIANSIYLQSGSLAKNFCHLLKWQVYSLSSFKFALLIFDWQPDLRRALNTVGG